MSEEINKENMIVLDVRPEVTSGRDPFTSIMKAVGNLKDEEGFHLINMFEPVPLYTVMKMKGFEHLTECIDGVWHIYFSRDKGGEAAVSPGQAGVSKAAGAGASEPEVIEIDVRGLEPPEPMVRIIETLPRVGNNTVLLVHHHREPMMLYDKLEHLGFEASTEKISEGYYKVRIKKKV